MSKNVVLEPTADEAAEMKAVIKELLAEMRRANKHMERDQHEIDRLKAQTRAILQRLEAA